MGIGRQPGFGSIFLMVVAYAPLAYVIRQWWVERGKHKVAVMGMVADSGTQPESGYSHAEGRSAISLDKDARTVTMLSEGVKKTYPYSSVRSWEVNKVTAGETIGVGVVGATAALGANLRAARQAKAASGLFVTVKDVDYPKWRIEMKDQRNQDRWMEILRQEINYDGSSH